MTSKISCLYVFCTENIVYLWNTSIPLPLQCLGNLLKSGVEGLSDFSCCTYLQVLCRGYNKFVVTLIHSILFQEYPGEGKDILADTPK
jgi:hypothetical protein